MPKSSLIWLIREAAPVVEQRIDLGHDHKASGTFGELVEQPVVIALGSHVPMAISMQSEVIRVTTVVIALGSHVPMAISIQSEVIRVTTVVIALGSHVPAIPPRSIWP